MSDRPLTILQLTHEGHGAGSTMMIASLSRQLAGRGHRVLVGCRAESVLARMVRDAGVPQLPLDFGRRAALARELDALMTRECESCASGASRPKSSGTCGSPASRT